MSRYNVIVVDNDPVQAEAALKLLNSTAERSHLEVKHCASMKELEKHLMQGYFPDIALIDIILAEPDSTSNYYEGILTARKLCANYPGVQIIYMSSIDHYNTCVYQTEHTYLLLKPLVHAEFEVALEKAISNLNKQSTRPFCVKSGRRIVRMIPSEIHYVESNRRKVLFFTDEDCLEVYGEISKIEKKLPRTFIRCHKSYMVNMEKIVEMCGDTCILNSGARIPISQKRSRETREAFKNHLAERK